MTAPLPICVLKNGMPVRCTKLDSSATRRGRLPAAPSMISGRFAAQDHLGRAVERRRMRDRQVDGCGGTSGTSPTSLAGDVFGQFQDAPGPAALPARRGTHRARCVGMRRGLTIWRAILVSGFIDATTSTIWKLACLPVMIAFCPVIMIIGIAPSCA